MYWKKYAFLASVFAMFSLPFLILSSHFLNTIEEISRKDTLYYMDLRSSLLSMKASDILNSKYDVFRAVRESRFINAGMEERKKILSSAAASAPDIIRELILLDSSGRKLFSTAKGSTAENYSGNPVFKNARYEDISVGAVTYMSDEPPQLLIAEPVVKLKGEKPDYVVMARLSLGALNRGILKMAEETPGNVALVDSGGQIICDSSYNYLFSAGLFAPKPVLDILKTLNERELDSYKGSFQYKGSGALFSISRVKSTDWWIYELVDENGVVDYFMYRWAKRTIAIGMLLIAAFSLISYKLALKWLNQGRH